MSSSKDQQQKKDPVVELLKEVVEANPTLEVAKYLLYANPNGSGIQNDKQPVYISLWQRINEMNASPSREFPYVGTELPTKSVGMTVRVRFTIEELVSALEILNLARARIYIENALGNDWPAKIHDVRFDKMKINLTFIKSMKSIVKGYLIDKLPTLIDNCYSAMYKSAGNFSYSLAETKLYRVHQPIMNAFLNWVSNSCFENDYHLLQDSAPVFGSAVNKANRLYETSHSRRVLMDEMWVNTTYVKTSDTYKYPPHFVKLCKVICARLGKILRTPASNNEEFEGEAKVQAGLNFLVSTLVPQADYQRLMTEHGGQLDSGAILYLYFKAGVPGGLAIADLKSKKKDFQNAVFDLLLLKMNKAWEDGVNLHTTYFGTYGNTTPDSKNFVRDQVIKLVQSLLFWNTSDFLDFQSSLVYGDSFTISLDQDTTSGLLTFKSFYTKGEYENSSAAFRGGVCNGRVMDAIYRFISVTSLVKVDNSRKYLDNTIELALINYADLSKFTVEGVKDPAIVFSSAALNSMPDVMKMKFSAARDDSGVTGIRQNGVMSLTSAIKDKTLSSTDIDLLQTQYGDLRVYANIFDEIANCYANMHEGLFELRKSDKTKEASRLKQIARHTGGAMMQVPYAQQPSYVSGVSGGVSPSYGVNVQHISASPSVLPPSNGGMWAPHASPSVVPVANNTMWAPHASVDSTAQPVANGGMWAPHASPSVLPVANNTMWAPHASVDSTAQHGVQANLFGDLPAVLPVANNTMWAQQAPVDSAAQHGVQANLFGDLPAAASSVSHPVHGVHHLPSSSASSAVRETADELSSLPSSTQNGAGSRSPNFGGAGGRSPNFGAGGQITHNGLGYISPSFATGIQNNQNVNRHPDLFASPPVSTHTSTTGSAPTSTTGLSSFGY